MTKRRYNTQGCQECGQPHTPCRADDDGIMQCVDCRALPTPAEVRALRRDRKELRAIKAALAHSAERPDGPEYP